jgi:hypothetical protein
MKMKKGIRMIRLLLLLLLVVAASDTSQIQSEMDMNSNVDILEKKSISHAPDFSVSLSSNYSTGSYKSPSSCTQYVGMSNCCSDPTHDEYGLCQDNSDLNCLDNRSAICSDSNCPTGLLCKYVNCPIGAKFCWGNTVCSDGHDSCSHYAALFCHNDISSDSLKVCFSAQNALSRVRIKPRNETDYSGMKSTGFVDPFMEFRSLKLGEFNFFFLTSLHIQANES